MADVLPTTVADSRSAESTVQVRLRLPRELHEELRRRVNATQAPSLDVEIVRILRGERPPVETPFPCGEPLIEDAGDLAALASEQGVSPVEDTHSLAGDFWPTEEGTDDFLDALRSWREEDTGHRP